MRRTPYGLAALHFPDSSLTLFISSAGYSSTLDAVWIIVVETEITVGLPVISTSRPT